MASKWNDHAGEVVFNSIDVLQKFAEFLRNDLVLIAEKERSLGFLNETLGDSLGDLSVKQFPKAKEVLNYFIGTLSTIEYFRKVMYHREHQLATTSFSSSIELAKNVKQLLKDREEAIKRYILAKSKAIKGPPENDPKLMQATTSYQSINTHSIQAAATYSNQLHRDLIISLSSFAHAQMEIHAKSVEHWAKFLMNIDNVETNEDVEMIIAALQESAQTFAPVQQP